MKKFSGFLKNTAISAGIMLAVCGLNYLLRFVLGIRSMVPMFFVLGVFFISICTEGYLYGVASAFVSAVLVNFMFIKSGDSLTFTFDVIASAFIILSVALLTCTLTTTLKKGQRIKKASIAEHMRANLLRAVSHDLRTPLTSIYASSSGIIENYDSLDENQKLELVNKIQAESHGLIRMLENLLSVTRVNGQDVKITKVPTVLWELVDSVVVRYNRYFPEQPLDIEIPEEFVTIPMDPMLIDQVIFNVLENANVHAVGLTKLKLKVMLQGDNAVFEISDDGCGISAEKMSRMFEGYFDSSEKNDRNGRRNLGIGLSVCSAIIKAHGGEIFACNNDMGGTSIYFTLKMEGKK